MKKSGMFAMLTAALLLTACQSMPMSGAGPAADHEAIEQLVARYEHAVNQGDVDSLLALYAADAVQAPPNESPQAGSEAIRLRAADNHAVICYDLHSEQRSVRVSGSLASFRAAFSETMTSREDSAEQTTTTGIWLLVMQRDGQGVWKIITEIWSDDAPLSVAEAG